MSNKTYRLNVSENTKLVLQREAKTKWGVFITRTWTGNNGQETGKEKLCSFRAPAKSQKFYREVVILANHVKADVPKDACWQEAQEWVDALQDRLNRLNRRFRNGTARASKPQRRTSQWSIPRSSLRKKEKRLLSDAILCLFGGRTPRVEMVERFDYDESLVVSYLEPDNGQSGKFCVATNPDDYRGHWWESENSRSAYTPGFEPCQRVHRVQAAEEAATRNNNND